MEEKNKAAQKNGKKPFSASRQRRPEGDVRRPDKRRPGAKGAPPKDAARNVALRALEDVFENDAYGAQALDRALSAARLSDEDRRLVASLFYFALENRLHIEHCLRRQLKSLPDRKIMHILVLAAAQLLYMDRVPDHAAVDEAVKQARRTGRESGTALVNGVLRNLIRARDAGELTLPDRDAEPEKYISEKYSIALPMVEKLILAYGLEETERLAAWSPDRGVESIRPNRLMMTNAQFEKWLDEQGFSWTRGLVEGAYRVSGGGRLAAHEGYRRGLFSIQGESSMLAAMAMQVKGGMQVLDACAAPGGKSCLMAEQMGGAGRVYAWDVHEHRVELIRAAARRLGLENIRPQLRDARRPNENFLGAMDAVLVDAPCSGLGVMGDKPDIKYRLKAEDVAALLPVQREILDACAAYVRPGGLLVYSTCTLLPEENQQQVEAFLERHPEFAPAGPMKDLPDALRERMQDGMLQLLPGRDGMDGFFIARLVRKAEANVG